MKNQHCHAKRGSLPGLRKQAHAEFVADGGTGRLETAVAELQRRVDTPGLRSSVVRVVR